MKFYVIEYPANTPENPDAADMWFTNRKEALRAAREQLALIRADKKQGNADSCTLWAVTLESNPPGGLKQLLLDVLNRSDGTTKEAQQIEIEEVTPQ